MTRPGTPTALTTTFAYTSAGQLATLNHSAGTNQLAHYNFGYDARGNCIGSREAIVKPGSGSTTVDKDSLDPLYGGTWTTVGSARETTDTTATLSILYFGPEATLTMGVGPDHGIYQYRLNYGFWVQRDGYAAAAGDDVIPLPSWPSRVGPNVLEIQNTSSKNASSSGNKVRFKTLVVPNRLYDIQTVQYNYGVSTLPQLRYAFRYAGLSAHELRRDGYSYDVAGNRTRHVVTIAGSPTTTNYTYNALNQLTGDGTHTLTYDNNGNMTSDGVNSYTWDRANRMLSMGSASYAYDGAGNRIQQTVSSIVTSYLLDMQPGLVNVLQATQGANTTRYVHAPRGIHAQKDASGNWDWMLQDGLGSVRQSADSSNNVLWNGSYEPYGAPFSTSGASQTSYGFTGEMTDGSGQVYLRARYYAPNLGVFTGLDPFEGMAQRPMSLNGYSWVEGNVINAVDPSGTCPAAPADDFDWRFYRCWDLANGLAARFNAPVTNFSWMSYEELEGATFNVNFWGGLNNAAILPSMAAHEDPRLVLQAIQEFGCQLSQNPRLLPVIGGVVQGARSNPAGAIIGGAIAAGIAIGIGSLLAANALNRLRTSDGMGNPLQYMQNACTGGGRYGIVQCPSYQQIVQSSLLDGLDINKAETVGEIPFERVDLNKGTFALYRSVSPTELAYIRGVGQYRSYGYSPSGGGKYFAFTLAGAQNIAGQFSNDFHEFYTLTVATYKKQVLTLGFIFPDTKAAGVSIQFDDEVLNQVYANMETPITELERFNPNEWH